MRHWRVLRALHNPRYAGAFVYGQRRTRKTTEGKTTTRALPREQWTALICDAHPGYISFEQYEQNLRTLSVNATAHGTDRAGGPAREGPALLQGLAICGRCGRRMTVRYHARHGTPVPDYQCVGETIQAAAKRCLQIPGAGVDATISQPLLDTVTPLALEVALNVQAELEARADETDKLRRSHVDRARQRAELARRRYLAVDPDNRLVADTLEADWKGRPARPLGRPRRIRAPDRVANAALSEQHKQRVRQLATDFPALWSDPATPARERKRIVRLLIEDVTLTKTDQIHLHVRFRRGQTTTLTIPKPLNSWQARQTPPGTLAEIDRLLDEHTDAQTAERLNQAGRRSGMNQPFSRRIVINIRRDNNLPSHQERLRARGMLTKDEIAQRLGVHPSTIKAWHRAGLLQSCKANDKNERLFEPPTRGDPRLVKGQGRRFSDREPAPLTPGGAL